MPDSPAIQSIKSDTHSLIEKRIRGVCDQLGEWDWDRLSARADELKDLATRGQHYARTAKALEFGRKAMGGFRNNRPRWSSRPSRSCGD